MKDGGWIVIVMISVMLAGVIIVEVSVLNVSTVNPLGCGTTKTRHSMPIRMC